MSANFSPLTTGEPLWRRVAGNCLELLRPQPAVTMEFVQTGAPLRTPVVSVVLHLCALIAILIFKPSLFMGGIMVVEVRPPSEPTPLIYYGETLPAVHDAGGASRGATGRPGGQHSRAPQPIRVDRGTVAAETSVDRAIMQLKPSSAQVKNVAVVRPPAVNTAKPLPQVLRGAPDVLPPPPDTPGQLNAPLISQAVVPPPPKDAAAPLKDSLTIPVQPPEKNIPANMHSILGGNITGGANVGVDESKGSWNGEGSETQVVITPAPGGQLGLPGGEAATLAAGPDGTFPGPGGTGGGAGAATGIGNGAGKTGAGTGAGNAGTGLGSSATARGGIAPGPGPGGTGSGNGSRTGVSISGSPSVVHLGSFGSGRSSSHLDTGAPGKPHPNSVVVIATGRSGGGFNANSARIGRHSYTIYVETAAGPAVIEFSEADGQVHADTDLVAPEPISTQLPANIAVPRMKVSATLDRNGKLQGLHLVDTASSETTTRVLERLGLWSFQPALRGDHPTEVKMLIGFKTTTLE